MTHPPQQVQKSARQGAHRQMKSVMDRVVTAGRQEGHCHLVSASFGGPEGSPEAGNPQVIRLGAPSDVNVGL